MYIHTKCHKEKNNPHVSSSQFFFLNKFRSNQCLWSKYIITNIYVSHAYEISKFQNSESWFCFLSLGLHDMQENTWIKTAFKKKKVLELFIGKDSDAGRDWGQEEKGTTEDEMAGWHYRLDGHESEWTPGVDDGQGGLACCDSWGCKELDMTERLNWTELN